MRSVRLILGGVLSFATGALASGACGSGSGVCADFDDPKRELAVDCANANVGDPSALSACLKGSGLAGSWTVDDQGMPAFDFGIEQRCDSRARVQTSSGEQQDDPLHLIGNGRGMVAMAHASGAVEIYSQDRGNTWINHVDDWEDPDNTSFPVQLGGGFNYLVVDGKVRSTRYNDLSVSKALRTQTRRFGVGYYETVTTFKDVRVTRRVFAADTNARALVAEVTLQNLSSANLNVGLVEFWDLNLHPVSAEPVTSSAEDETRGDQIVRSRRASAGEFSHTMSYSRQTQVASVQSEAKALPSGVTDVTSPAAIDYFPADVFLATIDRAALPDAAWLSDDELWDAGSTDREPPKNAADAGDGETRSLQLDGAEQGGVLALRVPVAVPTGASVTRRFSIGYATEDVSVEAAVEELRGKNGELLTDAAKAWKQRLAWMAVDAEDGGVVQRELAWSSYYVQAQATFSALRGIRSVGVGGATQFLAGLQGSPAQLALNAEGLIHLNPALARETLLHALSAQHGSTSGTPFRFPESLTGVDSFSDGADNANRSDSYFFVPAAVARYVAVTRDPDFLTDKTPYWPIGDAEVGSVTEHLGRALLYANNNVGLGADGLVGMGTGEMGQVLVEEASGAAIPDGASSVLNAGAIVYGLPLLAQLLEEKEPLVAEGYTALINGQVAALEDTAWNGSFYERGFSDAGQSLTPGVVFLSAQVLPLLAGVVEESRRDGLLDTLAQALNQTGPTPAYENGTAAPVMSAWLTEAYAQRDPAEAWQNLLDNTLAAHADGNPDYSYGVWTGPNAYSGGTAELPGAATVIGPRPEADYPAASTEAHMAMVRASLSLLGVQASPTGWRIDPRLPSENYSVVLPNLELHGTPTSIGGSITAQGQEVIELVVTLPSGARNGEVIVRVKAAEVEHAVGEDNTVSFSVPVRVGEAVTWNVAGL